MHTIHAAGPASKIAITVTKISKHQFVPGFNFFRNGNHCLYTSKPSDLQKKWQKKLSNRALSERNSVVLNCSRFEFFVFIRRSVDRRINLDTRHANGWLNDRKRFIYMFLMCLGNRNKKVIESNRWALAGCTSR